VEAEEYIPVNAEESSESNEEFIAEPEEILEAEEEYIAEPEEYIAEPEEYIAEPEEYIPEQIAEQEFYDDAIRSSSPPRKTPIETVPFIRPPTVVPPKTEAPGRFLRRNKRIMRRN
jgi:hypothetical protein